MAKTKALVKAKPKTRSKSLLRSKPQRQSISYYPPERRTYQFQQAPELDPQTRHVLVELEERVRTFHNLEDRIDQLGKLVNGFEKDIKNATIDETWWQRLQFAVTSLQKEFHDRIPALERSFDAVQNLVCRMDRLEKRMDGFENSGRTPTEDWGLKIRP